MKKNKIAIYKDLFWSFFKIGILTFGGGLAMLPMFKRECVENKHWVTEEEVLDLYAISQSTPGIIATNTATFIGYQQAGVSGGIIATIGVVAPSLIIICLVASVLKQYINYPLVQHALAGIRVVVCAMMLDTVYTMAKTGIKDKLGFLIFLLAFISATFLPIPLILILVLAGIIGIVAKRKGLAK